RWLAVHPGSGSEEKNWPEAKWTELLQRLMKTTSLNLLIVGGEAERDRLERLARALPPTRYKIMQGAPLSELAQWLASCGGFVGHDSGISHLAAAVGVRSLILWGQTPENVWRPRGCEMTILRDSKGLDQLSVEVVLHHLEELLNRD
ncbi:MAG TPA: glycosyltransferase family 9 protein, partial [Verrucomicrobiae bacterium]|nr:glycosyltransferase family 9 protein [Verrucomicrobiae bacterium]